MSEINWLTATEELERFFQERYDEVQIYLDLLRSVELATREGNPRFAGTDDTVSVSQVRILSSNLYLQLYNLVEATVTKCLESVSDAVENLGLKPADLSESMRKEYVKSLARTNVEMGAEKRLQATMELCDALLEQLPIVGFEVVAGGGGNWDDQEIEKLCKRLGFSFELSREARKGAKTHVRDDLNSLKLVVNRRNGLAHGSLSFVDCGSEMLFTDMENLARTIGIYLSEFVDAVVYFLNFEIAEHASRRACFSETNGSFR